MERTTCRVKWETLRRAGAEGKLQNQILLGRMGEP